MQKVVVSLRIVYGLMWTVFGLNFFLHFWQNPTMSEAGQAFAGAIFATGYLFPLIKIVEVAGGVLLLVGFFVPLALVLLSPILVGIVTLHLFLNPAGIPMAALLLVIHLILMGHHRHAFRGILQAR